MSLEFKSLLKPRSEDLLSGYDFVEIKSRIENSSKPFELPIPDTANLSVEAATDLLDLFYRSIKGGYGYTAEETVRRVKVGEDIVEMPFVRITPRDLKD